MQSDQEAANDPEFMAVPGTPDLIVAIDANIRCAQFARALAENGMSLTMDKDAGVLRIVRTPSSSACGVR